MSIREGEYVKANSERYWEIFNEINDDFDEIAIKTFKVSLPAKHGLRKSLMGKLVASLWTELRSIKGFKTTNNKEKGRLRLSLRRGGISGRTDTITIGREGIMQDN